MTDRRTVICASLEEAVYSENLARVESLLNHLENALRRVRYTLNVLLKTGK